MPDTILVMAGGAIGAALRFHIARWVGAISASGWPMGTLTVNLIGGLLMGVLAGYLHKRGLAEGWRLFFGVGLLGGFTTFSAFGLEMMDLIQQGRWMGSAAYAGMSVAGSVAMLALGLYAVRGA
jgi:fluoride exporter